MSVTPTPLTAPSILAGVDRSALSCALPADGEPLRVAFVGRPGGCWMALPPASPGVLVARPVEVRDDEEPGHARTALAGFDAHVIVAFDPGDLPAGLLDASRAVKLAWVTAPLARPNADGLAPPDDGGRASAQRSANYEIYDRVIAADPLVADGDSPFWRARPLPVNDRLYAPVRPAVPGARPLFVGRSTEHRERWLMLPKHHFDLLHYAHGLEGDRLLEVFAAADVALNVHPEPFPRFNIGLVPHLAAGHLVVSEPVAPYHGLEPGIDFVEVATKEEIDVVLHQLRRRPDTYQRVRLRGRAKAELFRASVVWPRIIGDLLRELAADARG